MTECTQTSFEFEGHFSKRIVARFDGGRQTSDAGGLLLRETDRRLKLLSRFAACFIDGRDASRIEHRVEEMVAQRIYGLALGYEDLNDHEQLRHDPLLAVLAGKTDVESALAGKSTLNRLELSTTKADRYKKIFCNTEAIDQLLVDVFIESYPEAPDEIVLDLDATDLPIHGHQEGRFFHGFYDHYCYLPLYIFCDDHLLGARLQSNIDGSAGALEEVQRIVAQIRKDGLSADHPAGDLVFVGMELMNWCEGNGVDFVFGLARNSRLEEILAPTLREAAALYHQTQKAARVLRNSNTKRCTAGPGRAELLAKPSRLKARPIRVTWSLHWKLQLGYPRNFTKNSTAPAATWKTASRNNSPCLPIVSVPKPCGPINCASTFRRSPMCWSPAYVDWL
jgi:hypothetical protein